MSNVTDILAEFQIKGDPHSRISAEDRQRIREALEAAAAGDPDPTRAAAKRATAAEIDGLLGKLTPAQAALERIAVYAERVAERMPKHMGMLLEIAQTEDAHAHVYALGNIAGYLEIMGGVAAVAAKTIRDHLACACHEETEPPPPEVTPADA